MLTYFDLAAPTKTMMLFSPIGATMMLWIHDLFQISYLGFSIKSIMIVVAVITLDFFTGVAASVYEYRKKLMEGLDPNAFRMSSSRGVRSAYKIAFYIILMGALSVLEDMMGRQNLDLIGVINWSRLFLFVLFIIWEYQSIGENIERRFGVKPRLFKFLDFIAILVDTFIKNSLGRLFKVDVNVSNKEEDKEEVQEPKV